MPPPSSGPIAQTLDRGLHILTLVSANPGGLSVAEIAAEMQLDRAIVYRLTNTLLRRGLVSRDRAGALTIGTGVLTLARSAFGTLQTVAAPHLTGLAEATGATASITVADGGDAVLLLTVEPPNSQLYLSYRPGFRHSIERSAFGVAILAGRAPQPNERAAVTKARKAGYAISFGEVMPGGIGVAAPILLDGRITDACVGVAIVGGKLDEDAVAPKVRAASLAIAASLLR